MAEETKRWTARMKSALVLANLQGKTPIAEASRTFDALASDIEKWIDEGKRGMESALRTRPKD